MLTFILIYVFVIGLVIGSFINCFIWRLYKGESLWNRSYCPLCHKTINWYDNIPVLSFFILRFKCRNCQKKISWQYPAVEMITAFLFILVFYFNYTELMPRLDMGEIFLFSNLDFIIALVRDWIIVSIAIIIFIYDLRWFTIPDLVILPATLIILILNIILGFNFLTLLILLLSGAGFFLIQFLVSRGRWIGGGDVRLGAFMGVCLVRVDYLILSILLSYWLGAIVSIWLLIYGKKKWTSKLPLGVFLMTGLILTIFYGEDIVRWYFSLFY